MKVTEFTKRALRFRREERDLINLGYRRHETDWELHRGWMSIDPGWRIVDAKVSQCGMYVYTKCEKVSPPSNC